MSVDDIFETVASVSSDVRGILAERRSYEDEENPSGERQLAADLYADEQFGTALLDIDGVDSYASEERQDIEGDVDGDGLHVSCDPLDGSSNLTSNNAMGTIVGVYDEPMPAPASALVGATYILYGPITTMVTARNGVVREFLIEDGSATVIEDDLTLPEEPAIYGFGGRIPDWLPEFADYVADIEDDRLKLRYAGAMVADVNQVLTYGGIFGYPMVDGRPEGKLRLQFEGFPMAYIVDKAGGGSTDGEQSLLEADIDELHQRSPVFVGNTSLIERLEAAMA